MQEEQPINSDNLEPVSLQEAAKPIYDFQPEFTKLGTPFNWKNLIIPQRLEGEPFDLYRMRKRMVDKAIKKLRYGTPA